VNRNGFLNALAEFLIGVYTSYSAEFRPRVSRIQGLQSADYRSTPGQSQRMLSTWRPAVHCRATPCCDS